MSIQCQIESYFSFSYLKYHSSLWNGVPLMQVMDLELEILDVWEKDGVSCERVRNRCDLECVAPLQIVKSRACCGCLFSVRKSSRADPHRYCPFNAGPTMRSG